MDIARLKSEPVHGRQPADGIAALAVPHQFWFCRRARGEIKQHRVVGPGRAIRREGFRKVRGPFVSEPALLLRRSIDHDADQLFTAKACEFRNLVLRRHHDFGTAAVEPVPQLIGCQQRGGGNHHHAEFHRRQHRLPKRNDVAQQEQQVIAPLEPLRPQEVRDLIGAARQRRERKLGLAVAAGIDNPERRAIPAVRVARQFRIEPVQRPVERFGIGPAEIRDSLVVIRPMPEQERAGFLKGCHVYGLLDKPLALSSLPATNAKRLRKGAKRRSNPELLCRGMDCFAEFVIARAFARPVGSQ